MNNKPLQEKLVTTKLPHWAIKGILQWAHAEGHSYGQAEVNEITMKWLCIFEELQKNAIVAKFA